MLQKDQTCPYLDKPQGCKNLHDLETYMANKPADLPGECVIFKKYGYCRFSVMCRFAGSHKKKNGDVVTHDEMLDMFPVNDPEKKGLSRELQRSLWKKTYDFKKADGVLKDLKMGNEKAINNVTEYMGEAIITKKKKDEANGEICDENILKFT